MATAFIYACVYVLAYSWNNKLYELNAFVGYGEDILVSPTRTGV